MKNLMLKLCSAVVLFGSVAIFFTACTSEETNEVLEQGLIEKQVEELNEKSLNARFKLAEALSKAIVSEEAILPALEEFAYQTERDGHLEIESFYHLQKDVPFDNLSDNTLEKVLENHSELNSEEIKQFCKVPGLAILLEGNIEAERYSSRVYIDDGFDDSDPNAHIKYYENGKLNSHPISVVPDAKAFVVRISEAYVAKGSLRYKRHENMPDVIQNIGKTACGEEILVLRRKAPLYEGVGSINNDPSNSADARTGYCGDPCDRDCQDLTDNLKLFYTTNDYEGWRGRGEFFWIIIFGNDLTYQLVNGAVQITGPPLDYINTGEFGSVNENTWYNPDYSSIVWDLDDDGDRIKYVAYEADGGNVVTLSFTAGYTFTPPSATGGNGANVSATIDGIQLNDGDDFIGETIADYCHDIFRLVPGNFPLPWVWGFQYNYGAVRMHLDER